MPLLFAIIRLALKTTH